jgi:hypothetical protein
MGVQCCPCVAHRHCAKYDTLPRQPQKKPCKRKPLSGLPGASAGGKKYLPATIRTDEDKEKPCLEKTKNKQTKKELMKIDYVTVKWLLHSHESIKMQ